MQELRILLCSHFLKCNSDKNEVLVVGWRHQATKVSIPHVMVGDSVVCLVDSVRNLGAVFDSGMTVEPVIPSAGQLDFISQTLARSGS